MTSSTRKLLVALALLGALLAMSTAGAAQVLNSGAQTISLNAKLAESLTLTLSGSAVDFTLTPGAAANPGSTTITATTSWVLSPGRTVVTVNAYFTSAVALTDGIGDDIPTSAFTISDNGGAAIALVNATAYSANGYRMKNISITGANKVASSSDTMAFNIDLSTMPQLPAGTYLGTLNIQAQATP